MLKRILGLLGWVGVILVFAAVALRWLPGIPANWQQWGSNFAIAGLVCTLLYILSQWREIVRSFSGREARFGSLAVASIVIVLAILVGINWLAARRNKRWDLTAAQQHSLSDQTKKILQGLDKPLKVYVFARSEDEPRFRERLAEYQYHSKQLQIEYVDPEKQPALARKYEPLVVGGTVVLERDGRIERVNAATEQALTNGLIKVLQGKQNKVYFVQGHDERTPDGNDANGYSTVGQYLLSDNFATDKLVLSQVRAIPDDATVLVIAGPHVDFLDEEINLLKGYLANGGKLLCLLDPREGRDEPSPASLIALLKEWGIEAADNMVINIPSDRAIKEGQLVDLADLGAVLRSDATFVDASQYPSHPLTQGLGGRVIFRMARSVSSIPEGANGRFAQNLVESSPSSWGESDLKTLFVENKVARDPAKGDKAGPVSLGAAVSAPVPDSTAAPDENKEDPAGRKETRIVVFGDADFAANQMLGLLGGRTRNLDILLNAVSWLAQQEDLMAIRPRDPEDRRVSMTPTQQSWVFIVTVFLIPGLILLTAVRVWWVRR